MITQHIKIHKTHPGDELELGMWLLRTKLCEKEYICYKSTIEIMKMVLILRSVVLVLVLRPVVLYLVLTLSPPIPLRLYTLPYWSNLPFLISDIRALWRSVLSARAPECQKLKMVHGLDQYGAKPFEQQQSETAGVEGVNLELEV